MHKERQKLIIPIWKSDSEYVKEWEQVQYQGKEICWEHLGMMDDTNYVENAIRKIVSFEQNGIFPGENLIPTYETKKNPLNPKTIKMMIQHYFK